MTSNIYLQPKAQSTLSETQEATSLMSSTKRGWPPFPPLFTIVLKSLSNGKGPALDMNHNYRRERDKSVNFSPC